MESLLIIFFLGVGGGGEPILAVVKILGKINVLLTEAMALHEGLFQHYQYQKVSVEDNSKLLIDCSVRWHIKLLVSDIKILASSFQFIQFSHGF